MGPKIHISKLQAVVEHIETAIEIYFNDKSLVSLITLSQAARIVLLDLCKHKKITCGIHDVIREDKVSYVESTINKPANFLKHADRDPSDFTAIRWEMGEFLIYESLVRLEKLGEAHTPIMRLYAMYFHAKHCDKLHKTLYTEIIQSLKEKSGLNKKFWWSIFQENPTIFASVLKQK